LNVGVDVITSNYAEDFLDWANRVLYTVRQVGFSTKGHARGLRLLPFKVVAFSSVRRPYFSITFTVFPT